jgi:hypothetical protein
MPSPGWIWAMICVWSVVGMVFVGYVAACLRRITESLEVMSETYGSLNGGADKR